MTVDPMNSDALDEAPSIWNAPRAENPVAATVDIPGSKSITNRLLVLAALADGPCRLRRPLRSRDTLLMASALRTLGIDVNDSTGENAATSCAIDVGDDWVITPAQLHGGTVDVGLAGTAMRFLPAVAGLSDGAVHVDGDPRARERPMRPILDALRHLGVDIVDEGRGTLPCTIQGRGSVPGGTVTVDASGSSQFVSGLLLAGSRFDEGVIVHHDGKPVPSEPHIAMTTALLRDCGVTVDDSSANTWQVSSGPISAFDRDVEPDLSNAAPFLAAALVSGGQVLVPRWPDHTTQAGDQLRGILAAMGADVALDRGTLTVTGNGTITGIDIDLHDVGELAPVIAAIAALADSPSHLRGIAHLRGHETDRLAALTTELNALGGDVTETEDGLHIRPSPLHGGRFATYHDHRMAMAAAVIGLVVDGLTVENVETTSKTLPNFTDRWALLVGHP